MEHNGHDKLNGVLRGFLGDSFTLDGKEGGLNMSKMLEHIKKEKPKMNVLLMGGIGVGKSSLINALFGKEIAKAGVGKPITQHLEKFIDEQKGLILWDTKGIEIKITTTLHKALNKKWKKFLFQKGMMKKRLKKRLFIWRICALKRLLVGLKTKRESY